MAHVAAKPRRQLKYSVAWQGKTDWADVPDQPFPPHLPPFRVSQQQTYSVCPNVAAGAPGNNETMNDQLKN
jgi:hypothetical protein